ncbi:MAG: DNA polymerase III subunit delta' [Deltaproteobacteria bacterium]|nr:DNA polymerase III subunit delta' [Deltaproteobacteria bacterium]
MSFADIYGHSKQVGMLKKALAGGRVGQSYIFSGLAAIGKKTLAIAFAQALNCENAALKNDSCDACPSCLKMIHGNHPDILLVTTEAQFIRIDAIRDIQRQMTFKPLEGRKRLCIIDDADKMNEQAANALLKTLEEPSADDVIILVTSRPYWLPQTILSRCRHLRMNPLPSDTVARFLVEQNHLDPSKALLLASLSGGSIGQAQALNSEDMIAFRAELGRLLTVTSRNDPLGLLILSSFLGQDKKEIKQGLAVLNTYFRDALVYKETAKPSMIINADSLPVVSSLARRLRGEQLLQNIAQVVKASETIEMNVNKSLTLETMAFKLHL